MKNAFSKSVTTKLFMLCLSVSICNVYSAWYRGSTHAHSDRNGGEISPDAVAQWYYDHGYDFLCLTDHNLFTDPSTITPPTGSTTDFVFVPSEEVTGKKTVHTSAIGISSFIDGATFNFDNANQSEIIKVHKSGTEAAGGIAILNHPSWSSGVDLQQMINSYAIDMMEVFNAATYFDNPGQISATGKWDSLLTLGRAIYGVASDDAHIYTRFTDPLSNNPGRGWVMVESSVLNSDSLIAAMKAGRFYASHGVMLKSLNLNKTNWKLTVEVDEVATTAVLNSAVTPYIVPTQAVSGPAGYQIQFIGPKGEILQTSNGSSVEYQVPDNSSYVRGRIIYKIATANGFDQYDAWIQPIYTDARDGTDTTGIGKGSTSIFKIRDLSKKLDFKVQNHILYFDNSSNRDKTVTIQLQDVLGRNIIQFEKKIIISSNSSTSVNLNNGLEHSIKQGMYLLQINSGQEKTVDKIYIRKK